MSITGATSEPPDRDRASPMALDSMMPSIVAPRRYPANVVHAAINELRHRGSSSRPATCDAHPTNLRPSRSMKKVSTSARNPPVRNFATRAARSATAPFSNSVNRPTSFAISARTSRASVRLTSNGPLVTIQSSTSSIACDNVGPMESSSSTNDGITSATTPTTTAKKPSIVAAEANPGRHRCCLSHPTTGDSARTRKSAMTTGKSTTAI